MSKHVVIVGAGVVGLSTAYYCAKQGHQVTVIERHGPQRDGCSFGNAGMVVPSHFKPLAAPGVVPQALRWMFNPESPLYIKPRISWDLLTWGLRFMRASTARHVEAAAPLIRDLSLYSRSSFCELEAAGLDFGLVKKGLLMLCKTHEALEEEAETARFAERLNLPAEVVDAKRAAEIDPNVTMDIAGAVYFPMDCHLSPEAYVGALQRELVALGADLRWNTEVLGWQTNGSRLRAVRTPDGAVIGDEFVLCGGSWSPQVARALGIDLPLQAGKGYSLTLKDPRQLPAICSIFCEARVAVTPIGQSLRVGGTMEIAGLNHRINPARVRGIMRAVPQYYPAFKEEDFAGIAPWHGLRPCSPDGLPYLGRSVRCENLICATGHAMMGLSLAPATGRLVEQLVSDKVPEIPLDLLSPDRF